MSIFAISHVPYCYPNIKLEPFSVNKKAKVLPSLPILELTRVKRRCATQISALYPTLLGLKTPVYHLFPWTCTSIPSKPAS
jgi:hypothetical protein